MAVEHGHDVSDSLLFGVVDLAEVTLGGGEFALVAGNAPSDDVCVSLGVPRRTDSNLSNFIHVLRVVVAPGQVVGDLRVATE